ncbi:hypothetical protein AAV94_03370 [Lampropedia cohaerens]|uniref:MYND finger n=1 Tax=Lampropedia cohaerens TaxID=1610491 RepID=A0A0U1Q213_9BURK|nr:hypothetical protein [Lampropedia cohaerens]KKW68799.1 hypothetical protein AAV94_03370 [Lampropedia cohaerens]
MSKWLLTVGLVVVAWLLWSRLRGNARAARHKAAPPRVAPPRAMVRCHVCGAQLDAALARRDGPLYTCAEHQSPPAHEGDTPRP